MKQKQLLGICLSSVALASVAGFLTSTWLASNSGLDAAQGAPRITAVLYSWYGLEVALFLSSLAWPSMATTMVCIWLVPGLCLVVCAPLPVGPASYRHLLSNWLRVSVALLAPQLVVVIGLGEAWSWSGLGQGLYLWASCAVYAGFFVALLGAIDQISARRARRVLTYVVANIVLYMIAGLARTNGSDVWRWMPNGLESGLLTQQGIMFLSATAAMLASSICVLAIAALVANRGANCGPETRPKMSSGAKRSLAVCLLFCLGWTMAPLAVARAYNKPDHYEITNMAWQVMRASGSFINSAGKELVLRDVPGECSSAGGPCGSSAVSQQEWDDFIFDVAVARIKIGEQPIGVPNGTFPNGDPCFPGSASTSMYSFDGPLGVAHFDLKGEACSPVASPVGGYVPYGIYGQLTVPTDGGPYQGKVLGWHSKHRDDDLDESQVVHNPLIGGASWDLASDLEEAIVGTIFVPFVCAYLALFGDGENCLDKAYRLADDVGTIDFLKALVPGVCDVAGIDAFDCRQEIYIGFWHLINVRDKSQLSNWYDDRQGMYLLEAGPEGEPGAIDVAITLVADLAWTVLDSSESKGDDRYQIDTSADGHQASDMRDGWEWETESLGNTMFSPLDNFAYYGYANVSGTIKRLGWPLHAIGDATVPMHIVATPGHGHAVYEAFVTHRLDELLHKECEGGELQCGPETLEDRQVAQARRVLQIAYRWRTHLETNGVRNFITALGLDTLSRIGGDSADNWPFCDVCSTFFKLNESNGFESGVLTALIPLERLEAEFTAQELADDPMVYYDEFMSPTRELVESAMGAKIAFLMWAAESMDGGGPL